MITFISKNFQDFHLFIQEDCEKALQYIKVSLLTEQSLYRPIETNVSISKFCYNNFLLIFNIKHYRLQMYDKSS